VTRTLAVAAAQLGPVARHDSRASVVERLVDLLRIAADGGAELVVFPELALTTFFPRWLLGEEELLSFFEREIPSPVTKPLFDEAARRGVGFHLGYAELTPDGRRYNSAVLVERDGSIVARYRKVHLPGHEEFEEWRPFQHLERRYFEAGPADGLRVHDAFGGRVGMAICNDRRWPETYRVLGLQAVELVLIGYNTPIHYPPDPGQDRLAGFHNTLVMAAGAYQNGTWVVGVAKGGMEEGVESLCESQVIAPSGEVVAKCATNGDEVVVVVCDLDACLDYKETLFDFDRYRRPEAYSLITATNSTTACARRTGGSYLG
jgi:predicted amidohydrolase